MFENRGYFGVYEERHPDEYAVGHFPKLLLHDAKYLGVVRIDLSPPVAFLRRVAIDEPWQRQGFGRILLALAEPFVRGRGISRIESMVAPEARAFYAKCGYVELNAPPVIGANVHKCRS